MKRLTLTFAALLIVLGLAAPALATDYYVATTGNDTTGTGAIGAPWLTVPKGLRTFTASDHLWLRVGIYVIPSTYGNAAGDTYAPGATSWATAPTISNYPGEAVELQLNGLNMDNGISDGGIGYLIIQGDTRANFTLKGAGGTDSTAIRLYRGAHHVRLTKTTIRDFTSASAVGGGSSSCPSVRPTNIEIIDNLFTGNGNDGHFDHPIYFSCVDGLLVERNDFIANSAYAIHFWNTIANSITNVIVRFNRIEGREAGSVGSAWGITIRSGAGNKIYDNLIIGQGAQAVKYTGCIDAGPGLTGLEIYNNTCYDVTTGVELSAGSTGTLVKNNILNTVTTPINDLGGNGTLSNNHCQVADTGCSVTGAAGFVNAAGGDFSLALGSTAINAGEEISGFPFNTYTGKTKPNIGAFDTFTCNAAAMVNEKFLDLTCSLNHNTPVQPSSGIAGITALVGAVARTTTNSSVLAGTDSVIRTTFNGAVSAGGETWTSTYAPGNICDSVLIGGTLCQKAFGHTAQAVVNNSGTSPPAEPGTPLIVYNLDDVLGTTADNTGSSGATDDGTWSGTFVRVTGKNSFGVQLTDLTAGSLAIPYGNTVNPSTQSLTVAFWVNVPAALTSATRTYFGHAGVASNRFYISTYQGTWHIGIQGSSDGSGATNLSVTEGWNRVCLSSSSTTDIATLSLNGTVGTGEAAKAFTSYALPSNLTLGSPFGASNNPGVIYDDPKLWETAESCADDWAAAEPPPPVGTMVLTQKRHQWMESHYVAGTTTPVLIGAQQAAIEKAAGESFALKTQTDATVAGGSIAQRIHYKRNGGASQPVTDDCNTSDQFCFVGTGTDPTDLLNESPAACLTGALTPIIGSTQITMDAVPVTIFTTDSCTTHVRVLKFGSAAVPTDTYDLFEHNQTLAAFDTYDPVGGARITVAGAPEGIQAPTNLHFSGPSNSSLAALIWSPVTHVGLVAYEIYRGIATGVYDATPTYTVTLAGALTAHSPATQRFMRLLVADEYFFVVKARDVDGNLSAASSETSITVTGQSARAARQ